MTIGMTIRHAVMNDLDALAAVEAECFPPAEAATREDIRARLAVYPNHFWLLFDGNGDDDSNERSNGHDGRLVSFVNGMTTDVPDLADEMYSDASLHDERGAWQMIFGVNTIPAYRRRGCASRVIRHAADEARTQGRRGVVLTCKEAKIGFYARLGFVDEGLSSSTHGGVPWHQMRLTF
ncbi:GNAT family acetyltransferase [Bifidobacterium vansinderenii]|uniref:GNAT family acetyltransferase n=2 Tax=Bifidobacterium vansinderenii TaxID=1984871 RepID=A0A229VZB1_9BIFI|nr:GNAT family acetyltransferase [Bifidobacterium vansinderenii]